MAICEVVMIEIYLLEQLAAFAKCGTLSKAAEELLISQPAPAHQPARAEPLNEKVRGRAGRKALCA